uniref:Uncharacterized protein n=1 Tax=Anopheles farauti TaxID=69004 RepID=A0A182Q5D8_9DIPT
MKGDSSPPFQSKRKVSPNRSFQQQEKWSFPFLTMSSDAWFDLISQALKSHPDTFVNGKQGPQFVTYWTLRSSLPPPSQPIDLPVSKEVIVTETLLLGKQENIGKLCRIIPRSNLQRNFVSDSSTRENMKGAKYGSVSVSIAYDFNRTKIMSTTASPSSSVAPKSTSSKSTIKQNKNKPSNSQTQKKSPKRCCRPLKKPAKANSQPINQRLQTKSNNETTGALNKRKRRGRHQQSKTANTPLGNGCNMKIENSTDLSSDDASVSTNSSLGFLIPLSNDFAGTNNPFYGQEQQPSKVHRTVRKSRPRKGAAKRGRSPSSVNCSLPNGKRLKKNMVIPHQDACLTSATPLAKMAVGQLRTLESSSVYGQHHNNQNNGKDSQINFACISKAPVLTKKADKPTNDDRMADRLRGSNKLTSQPPSVAPVLVVKAEEPTNRDRIADRLRFRGANKLKCLPLATLAMPSDKEQKRRGGRQPSEGVLNKNGGVDEDRCLRSNGCFPASESSNDNQSGACDEQHVSNRLRTFLCPIDLEPTKEKDNYGQIEVGVSRGLLNIIGKRTNLCGKTEHLLVRKEREQQDE